MKKLSRSFVWIIIGLLLIGLAGFGVTGFVGGYRNIGTVGDQTITTQDYFRAVRAEMQALSARFGQPLTFAQAEALGVSQRALGQLVVNAALSHEAETLGFQAGDASLQRRILATPAFRNLDGEFDRDAYSFVLENRGISEAEFEDQLRAEETRSLLMLASLGGIEPPTIYGDVLGKWYGERRDLTWARLDPQSLSIKVPDPDAASLKVWFTENQELFTRPETKRITYAWIRPEMLATNFQPDDSTLESMFQTRQAEFSQPEQRLLDQLAFLDESSAAEAARQIKQGQVTLEELAVARGLEPADIDIGAVSAEELADAARDGVFSAVTGEIVGPLPSPLGPALYRVNAILPARNTTFADARGALLQKYQLEAAAEEIAEGLETIEDLLAGGATLEEIARESNFETGEIEWSASTRAIAQLESIASHEAFDRVASDAQPGDFPQLLELENGGWFALRVDAIEPSHLPDLNEAREEADKAWRQAEMMRLLNEHGQQLIENLRSGSSMEDLGLNPTSSLNIARTASAVDLPPGIVVDAFSREPDAAWVWQDAAQVYLARVDAVHAADSDDPAVIEWRERILAAARTTLSEDLFQILAQDIQSRIAVRLDPEAIDAVNIQF